MNGGPMPYDEVHRVFRILLAAIGLRQRKGRHNGPCLHDLRHTFAVRALETGPKQRGAVDRHIVALSTYMGHAGVSATYWYLRVDGGQVPSKFDSRPMAQPDQRRIG